MRCYYTINAANAKYKFTFSEMYSHIPAALSVFLQ